jgi:hypothetical protein
VISTRVSSIIQNQTRAFTFAKEIWLVRLELEPNKNNRKPKYPGLPTVNILESKNLERYETCFEILNVFSLAERENSISNEKNSGLGEERSFLYLRVGGYDLRD